MIKKKRSYVLLRRFGSMEKRRNIIRGNNDGPGGRNETYDIGSRKNVPRKKAVREVKKDQHPGTHVYTLNGQEYVER